MKLYKQLAASAFALFALYQGADAAAPSGYYSKCEGLYGKSLLSALNTVVGDPDVVGYDGLWSLYGSTDLRADGSVWDMYSTKSWRLKTNQCGNYKNVGDCYNREHSFPKSWFNEASPMKSDAFHVYPTDGKVNGQRSNHPYGECEGGTTLPGSGNVKALGRLGNSTFPGYSGTVFEPDDEYKGDFARTYFYMAAAYNTRIAGFSSPMLAGNSYPAYKDWAIELLLKWHRQDPVSSKETNRNDAVYAAQGNRNPFIDHPELAEHIWGDRKTERWEPAASTQPELTLPVNGANLDLGATVPGFPRTATFTVKGVNLAANVSLAVSGTGFSVSPATITKSAAMGADGAVATVTFAPTSEGSFTGRVSIPCGNLSKTVNLSGSAIASLPAGPVKEIGDDSFVAVWTNVGDADADGQYTIDVRRAGTSLGGFPRKVSAASQRLIVDNLDPLTTYTYTVKSEHLVSDEVSVTTLAPIPSIDFYFDGDLMFQTLVDEPSEVAELVADIANITGAITLEVAEPFQLSMNKTDWSGTAVMDAEEDRVYVRALSSTPGTFHATLVATAGDYVNDDVELSAVVSATTGLFEDFEADATGMGTYKPAIIYQGTGAKWKFSDAGMWAGDDDHSGSQSVRMGKTAASCIEMAEDCETGLGVVSLWTMVYSSDSEFAYELEYSTDGGSTWTSAGSAKINSREYTRQTFTVNAAGPARLRVRQTSGKRFNIDDIEATAYSSLVPDFAADYHRWDAYCLGGNLVVEASEAVEARVYCIDGTEVFTGRIAEGTTSINVAPGLYIVAVDDFTRRVLVK